MAQSSQEPPLTNGIPNKNKPIELSFGLAHSPGTRIYLHLTILSTSLVLFMTSGSIDGGQAGATMGSFVYAMPDRYNPTQPLSTPLFTSSTTIDFNTRLAKLLVRRTKKLCYVGGSVDLSTAAGGGSIEEEMEAFRAIVAVVTQQVADAEEAE